MAQRYIPEIVDGDKRMLLIGGEAGAVRAWRASRRAARCAATWPPAAWAWRSRSRARPRDRRDRSRPISGRAGLLLVGLDVIGDYLTEVNVTSPTCFQEITQQTGFDVAAMFIDALERAAAVV